MKILGKLMRKEKLLLLLDRQADYLDRNHQTYHWLWAALLYVSPSTHQQVPSSAKCVENCADEMWT